MQLPGYHKPAVSPTMASVPCTGATTEFHGGQAHEGMLRAASWLLDRELAVLQDLLQQHPGFRLRLIGHSLGAGTATLAAMLLKVLHLGTGASTLLML